MIKVKNDHRSKFSNLSNWKEEAWKKSRLQRDSNPWRPRYRCDALPTELWSHTLTSLPMCGFIAQLVEHCTGIAEVTGSNPVDLAPNVWLHSSVGRAVGRASHRYRGGHGFESRWRLDFFQASSFQLLKLENLLRWSFFTLIYNRSSNIWFISYILHIMSGWC